MSRPRIYYNEFDERAAAWLRELVAKGVLPDGEVDTRSIVDVQPDDLRGFTQCHFFAGIGGWSLALRLAGWPDERHVWTGSCPCQPFSAAGLNDGEADPRHLWPTWFPLIRECRPHVVFGEQVEGAIAHGWLDLVCDDMEGEGYAVAPVGLPAPCVGAFHNRPRLWFVADTERERGRGWQSRREDAGHAGFAGEISGLADDDGAGRDRERAARLHERWEAESGGAIPAGDVDGSFWNDADGRGEVGDMVDSQGRGRGEHGILGQAAGCREDARQPELAGGVVGRGFWDAVEWLQCTDGKARPVEPGTFPLAHGIPARVGRLRGYGNAIVPQVAAEIIAAYLEVRP